MKRFIFFPMWNYRALEARLLLFEEQGWRLEKILFSYIFVFKKSKPKKVDYVFYNWMAKDGRRDLSQMMIDYELKMLSVHNATRIRTKSTYYHVYRITNQNSNLSEYKAFRSEYFNHVLFQYLLISSYFPIVGIGIFFASIWQQGSVLSIVLSGIYLLLSFLAFLYKFLGFIIHRSSIRNCSNKGL